MGKIDDIITKGRNILKVLLAMFCAFIGTSVAFVMFRVYDPNQNALRALCSVCMDVICIIILFILIISLVFDNYGRNRTTRLYGALLVASIWAMFLDFLNWAFDGSLKFGHLTYWFTTGSLCMGSVLACIFSLYLYRYMEEIHNLRAMRRRAIFCAALNLASFVFTFALALTGTAFQFVDGHYETGVLYEFVPVIPILTLLYLTGYIIRNKKKIGLHDVIAVAGYIIFMIIGALIESFYNIGTTYVAVALADIYIYAMLQNEILAEEKRNVQKWMKRSRTDELTGFYNRYAYEADIAMLETEKIDDDFIYVSADVNSLKIVNDSLGHDAGDELLMGAAECLEKSLGSFGKLYRIGGDEFIGLIYANEVQFDKMQKDIEMRTQYWSGELVQNLAISCGFVSRKEAKEMTIRQMAILADHRMYQSKEEYYQRMGLERRRV